MLAQFPIPTHTYYARNYASIIAASLTMGHLTFGCAHYAVPTIAPDTPKGRGNGLVGQYIDRSITGV